MLELHVIYLGLCQSSHGEIFVVLHAAHSSFTTAELLQQWQTSKSVWFGISFFPHFYTMPPLICRMVLLPVKVKYEQYSENVPNYMKLKKISQHVLVKVSLEMKKHPTFFFYSLLLDICATFLSLPISYPSFWYQLFLPEWSSGWAVTSFVSLRLTWWDVSNPLVSKYIHIQEENIISANIMGVKLSHKPHEVYPAVQLVRGYLAVEVILKLSAKWVNMKQPVA